jgi:uncharacterized protein (DUF885 family)
MKLRRIWAVLLIAPALTAATQPETAATDLDAVVSDYEAHALSRNPFAAVLLGQPPLPLPREDREDLEAEAAFSKKLLERLAKIDTSVLSAEQRLSVGALAWLLEQAEQAPLDYDYTFPAPYNVISLTWLAPAFQGPLASAEQRGGYLDLFDSVTGRLDMWRDRLRDQRARGILMPKRQVPRAIDALTGLKAAIGAWGLVDPARLEALPEAERAAFIAQAKARSDAAAAAIDLLIADLGPDYLAAAPDKVGLAQYPGGREYYRYLVKRTATFDTTPEQLRDLGKRLLEENNRKLDALARELGVPNGRAGLRDFANSNPRFIPKTPEDVEAKYRSCMTAIEPQIAKYFPMPKAPYGVRRLEPAAEAGMTFGYYDQPRPGKAIGEYRYNGSNLESRSLISACALIFHELVPGHHLHVALQQENEALPDFRKTSEAFFAFNEGWADYGSNFAHEIGALDDPADYAGRLMLNSMSYTRLVVDVGLNYDGWTYDEAVSFMKDNLYFSDKEIESEVLRYGADLPSQALAYGAGLTAFQAMRREAEERQGAAFDIAAFNREAIGHGALPLSVLEDRLRQAFPARK